MTEAEAAWVAGIIDGEGCLAIQRSRASTRADLRTDAYRLLLKVTMGCEETVRRLHALTGQGTVQNHCQSKRNVNASFSWLCWSQQVLAVLQVVGRFIFTKREEARMAVAFMVLQDGIVGGAGGNPPVPAARVDAKAALYWSMRMAKSRWRFYRRGLSAEDVAEIRRLGLEGGLSCH